MVKKNVELKDLSSIKKNVSENIDLKELKHRHFIAKDRKLLNDEFELHTRKLQRKIKKNLNLIEENFIDVKYSKANCQKSVKILNELLVELDEKSKILNHQIKIVSEAKGKVYRKKIIIERKIKIMNNSLKIEGGKRRVIKKEKLRI